MSESIPTVVLDSGRDFGGKSPEELASMLDNLTPDGGLPDEGGQVPEPAPAEVPEPAPVPDSAPEPKPEGDSEPEEEMDLAASEREGDRIKMRELEAKILLQQAHASRLAGEIGYLRNQNNKPASEPYEPQSQVELDRLALLEQRFAESESRRTASEVSQAVVDAFGSLDGPWVEELKDEIASIAPKYKDYIEAAKQVSDPELARQYASSIAMGVKAEAMSQRWERNHASLVERKASSRAENDKAKRAAASSASGAVPASPPKAKSYADLDPKEADAWLRENVR